jgi:hypothetical protein
LQRRRGRSKYQWLINGWLVLAPLGDLRPLASFVLKLIIERRYVANVPLDEIVCRTHGLPSLLVALAARVRSM